MRSPDFADWIKHFKARGIKTKIRKKTDRFRVTYYALFRAAVNKSIDTKSKAA